VYVCMNADMCICMYVWYVYVNVNVYNCVRVYVCVYMCVCMNMDICICMCVWYVHVHVNIYNCVCVHVRVYVRIRMHACYMYIITAHVTVTMYIREFRNMSLS